ncbi:eukaryotic translation initiation factor 4G-like protein [Medicago truncatula]|uniref:Eukaryotic translation initiation factor 4G n=1 Tax=Medicago truncatula TaxID=3880 RepID=A0A072TL86_MEDTR|nr:eukaryotic translation initiation factor 4G-like protein [Medicago truncatula]
MSYNQSKTEKNDAFYRKSGRSSSFNQQRGPSGGHGRGSGGQAPASSLNSNRSFSKKSNNAQGGQYRVNPSPVNSTEPNSTYAARTIHNGTHVQPQMHGASDGPVAKASESTAAQRSPRVAQNAPTSQPPPVSSEPTVPTSPAKGDTSKAFPFQFGSIVPGVMNGVAIPARTSSAPPNLDEQKRDQARHDSIKPVPSAPIPTVPKPQQPPRNDAVVTEKTNARDTHLGAKAKKDPQLPALTPASQMQRPSAVPVPGMSMPTPFQQSQQSLQFGGPNPQIQSQGMSSTPMHIPMPMSIPIGNVGQVQQPVFIPGLQPHPMHSHGMMHPSHNLSFAHQMGHQLPHQLGNMGIGTGPPYPQQQGGNFAGPRKTTTVKITHPETHEELRLDKRADGYSDGGSSGARPHPNVPSQSHPVKSIAASQPSNYYPSGSYSSSPPYYQPPGSLPLTSSQITPNTQPPIFNYPVNNGPQNLAFINSSSLSSLPVNKVSTPIPHIAEAPTAERSREVPKVTSSASTGVSVTIKPSAVSAVTDSSLTNSSISGVQNPDTSSEISTQHSKSSEDSSISSLPKQSAASVVTDEKLTVLPTPAVTVDSVSVVTNNEANTREPVSRSNSAKDNQKKSGKIGQSSQDQVSVQSPTAASMQSRAVDSSISDTGVSTPVGSETNHFPAIITEDLLTSEGSVAEVADSLSDHKHDKIDESSEDLQSADLPEANKETNDSAENACSDSMSHSVSGTKDRPNLEPNKAKTTSKGKKKRKEFLQKADAAGTTSDLYNAYKGPEEKKETGLISESSESECTSEGLKQLSADSAQLDAAVSEKSGQNKAEPDDWEDAADVSTPKLEVDDKSQQDFDGSGSTEKKYSRDFLLKFSEQCITLPEGFEITADIAAALMNSNVGNSRDSHPSPGRTVDRSRMEHRGNVVAEEDKWNKVSNAFHSGRGLDGSGGFRHGQGGNFGVLRNPRGPAPIQYGGAILSGPMQSGAHQGGMQRNSPDGERWQRSTSFQQRGLIPSPQYPLQMMHKAEKKYEIGKVSDAEEAKQRQLKAILNKLTPQNFDRLFEQVKAVNIDNAITLTGVISQIFEKALMEPTFCEMYANFCSHLAAELPDLSVDNEKITFKRLLLNKCQEEFERGEREQEEANKVDEAEGEVKLSNEEREQRRTKARRRMLGNIRLIGELYKKKMLTERIMHECIKKLLGQCQDPDEEDVEALCKLMSTIGEMIDHPKAKEHMDVYFERLKILSNNMNLSSRVRFMLKDVIDLRRNRWQVRRKVDGPKKIEEVHRDAVQERQAQAQVGRTGRGMGNNQSARRNPMDFGPRGSPMLSPPSPMGGPRGLSTQTRGYGLQDARFEERQSYEPRTLPINFPQRPLGNESITLGPQGGLARGMSSRGPTNSNMSIPDVHSGPGDSHRMPSGINGYGNLSERTSYGNREDLASRYMSDRPSSPAGYDHSSAASHNINYGNRDLRNDDRNLNRPVATSPHAQPQGPIVSQNASTDEQLRDMSLSAIREYYSARDVNEVAQCIKDLNSPNFHPSMVSLWVTDSFERKDAERDLLAKLLVKLGKSQDGLLSPTQLIEGFETVLSTLEDAVNDAPKAPEFLGRIFAELITESLVGLNEIGQLVHDGGEEPGSLLEFGLAADVLGSTLEAIKHEKGDVVLSEIRTSSTLRLESFRPPNNSTTSRKLEQFI